MFIGLEYIYAQNRLLDLKNNILLTELHERNTILTVPGNGSSLGRWWTSQFWTWSIAWLVCEQHNSHDAREWIKLAARQQGLACWSTSSAWAQSTTRFLDKGVKACPWIHVGSSPRFFFFPNKKQSCYTSRFNNKD